MGKNYSMNSFFRNALPWIRNLRRLLLFSATSPELDWQVDWSFHWLIGWLMTDYSMERSIDWLIDWAFSLQSFNFLMFSAVTDFAKKTGDYASLSATDIKVIALTLLLEKETVGLDHIRTEPVRAETITHKPVVSSLKNEVRQAANTPGFFIPKTETDSSSVVSSSSKRPSRVNSECEVGNGGRHFSIFFYGVIPHAQFLKKYRFSVSSSTGNMPEKNRGL